MGNYFFQWIARGKTVRTPEEQLLHEIFSNEFELVEDENDE